jgi:molecular chaperone DnaK (HSP70)
MFKWKVYSYSNLNWKEKRFEKEFDDMWEYNNFLSSTPEFSLLDRWLSFDSMFNFNRYLDDFFDSKISLEEPKSNKVLKSSNLSDIDWLDLSKYEEEVNKIDREQEEKAKKRWKLESALEKLKSYAERFKKENREDMLKKIEEDIKKVEKDLAKV